MPIAGERALESKERENSRSATGSSPDQFEDQQGGQRD